MKKFSIISCLFTENIFECEDVNNCAENKIYKCNHCTGTFTRKSHWKMHMNGLPNLKSHICSVCEAKCTTQCELSRHMSQHKEKHTKSNCATCLRIFYTSECLQIHIRIAHDEPSPDVREALQRKKQPQHLGQRIILYSISFYFFKSVHTKFRKLISLSRNFYFKHKSFDKIKMKLKLYLTMKVANRKYETFRKL